MNAEQFARRMIRIQLDAVEDMVERQRRHAIDTILETIRIRHRLLNTTCPPVTEHRLPPDDDPHTS